VTVVLALAAAASWGSSDFVAGLASRRASGLSVVVAAHLTGLVALLVAAPVLADLPANGGAAGWGAAAGICGGMGAALLYRGLAIGRMAVVAPVTAAGAAALPTAAGLLLGNGLDPLALGGIALALPAVVLIALPRPETATAPGTPAHARRRVLRRRLREPGLAEALLSGAGFGGFYLFLERAPADGGLLPLIAARVASVLMLAGFAVLTGRRVLPSTGARAGAVAVGVLDVAAATLYLFAARTGPLAVVAVLSSLYPVTTVGLARAIEGERCHRWQLAGLVTAGVAVGLLSVA
jgi:drug/metabolite transporter (DMT)-like permease